MLMQFRTGLFALCEHFLTFQEMFAIKWCFIVTDISVFRKSLEFTEGLLKFDFD